MKKTLSIVIPAFNEERNIVPVFEAIKNVMQDLPLYEWNLLFVDDGSRDQSVQKMKELAVRDAARVGYIELSRNFGKEVATTAGLLHAKGDAVILMDADLQHPPEVIREFLQEWEKGADVVIGIRSRNQGEGFVRKVGSKVFYYLMRAMSETELISGETDFRLIDRRVVEAFKGFTERNRLTRALLNWLGFKKVYVRFIANPRLGGEVAYSHLKLIRLALNSFISHSLFPLKIAGYLGGVITLFAGSIGFFIFYVKFIAHDPWGFNFSGPAALAMLNLFLVGIVLVCLGLVAIYIGNIHQEVANRPLYIIRDKKEVV